MDAPHSRRMRRRDKDDPPATREALMEASLSYLARFSSTRAGLARHLKKKFRHAEGEALSALLEECLARLEELRLLDDARFAADRARGLRAQGKSGRAIRQK